MRLTKCDFERIQQNEIEKEIRRNEPGRENYSFDLLNGPMHILNAHYRNRLLSARHAAALGLSRMKTGRRRLKLPCTRKR